MEYCSAGKFKWKMLGRQILQKSQKWQILAFMNKIKLKREIKNLLLYFAKKKKMTLESSEHDFLVLVPLELFLHCI